MMRILGNFCEIACEVFSSVITKRIIASTKCDAACNHLMGTRVDFVLCCYFVAAVICSVIILVFML